MIRRFRNYTVEVVEGLKTEAECDGLVDYEEHVIEIGGHLRGKEELDTLIHELLHVIEPRWGEKRVVKTANDITELLWQWGYRKRKPRKSKDPSSFGGDE